MRRTRSNLPNDWAGIAPRVAREAYGSGCGLALARRELLLDLLDGRRRRLDVLARVAPRLLDALVLVLVELPLELVDETVDSGLISRRMLLRNEVPALHVDDRLGPVAVRDGRVALLPERHLDERAAVETAVELPDSLLDVLLDGVADVIALSLDLESHGAPSSSTARTRRSWLQSNEPLSPRARASSWSDSCPAAQRDHIGILARAQLFEALDPESSVQQRLQERAKCQMRRADLGAESVGANRRSAVVTPRMPVTLVQCRNALGGDETRVPADEAGMGTDVDERPMRPEHPHDLPHHSRKVVHVGVRPDPDHAIEGRV